VTPGTLFAACFMSLANLKAMGQKGLVGTNSTLTTPGSSSFTLVIICISAKVIPVSGSWTFPTSTRTLSSSSVKYFTLMLLTEIRLGLHINCCLRAL